MSNEDKQVDSYAQAISRFGEAVEVMNRGNYEEAREAFEGLARDNVDEPALAERCRTYARICGQRGGPAETEPTAVDQIYLRGVMLANEGQLGEAIQTLDRAIAAEPMRADYFYARASAYALSSNVEAAIVDLRQAIALDPTTRFQAVNDADFEQIREEPAFIDIIEPTPTGA